jgi:hypothetical protein
MPIPSILDPKKKYKLIRIGRNNDGGYLVGENSLKKTEILLSFGIGDDWSFEKNFKIYNINCLIQCYDDKPILKYLIRKLIIEIIFLPYHRRLYFFKYLKDIIEFIKIKKAINFFEKKIFYDDLKKILHNINNNNIFLKIDIEGSEYRILDDILENQKRILGIVIEFHDFDYHKKIICNFCEKLSLNLIHIHPNNCAPLDKEGNPTVIELTFERNPIILEDDVIFPHEFDMKNNNLEKDIRLIFEKN